MISRSKPAYEMLAPVACFRVPPLCALLLILCLGIDMQVQAQAAPRENQTNACENSASGAASSLQFDETLSATLTLAAAHPEMPGDTADYIAAIESNLPTYRFGNNETRRNRYDWVSYLISLESRRIKTPPDLRSAWYELVAAKAPELSETEMDSIAASWWSEAANQAVKYDAHGEPHSASFEEVRAHFQQLRTGSETQAIAAKHWLIRAKTNGDWENLNIPPQAQDVSPLATLLARHIDAELRLYDACGGEKLRTIVQSLIAGKFTVEIDGIAHAVTASDVAALLDRLSSTDTEEKRTAKELLQKWLKQAIDVDLRRQAEGLQRLRRAYSSRH